MHPSFKLTVHIFVLPYIVPDDDDDEEINLLTYLLTYSILNIHTLQI